MGFAAYVLQPVHARQPDFYTHFMMYIVVSCWFCTQLRRLTNNISIINMPGLSSVGGVDPVDGVLQAIPLVNVLQHSLTALELLIADSALLCINISDLCIQTVRTGSGTQGLSRVCFKAYIGENCSICDHICSIS